MTTDSHHRQRAVKVSALLDELRRSRATVPDPPSWPQVRRILEDYSNADWRNLSVAAGRPDRVPSPDTRDLLLAAVDTVAAADEAVSR